MLDWLATTYISFKTFLWSLVLSVYAMLKDFSYWLIDMLSDLAVTLLDSVSYLLNSLDVSQYFSFLPPETNYMLSISGFSEAMGMIITSLLIRFILQLIPFVRWGS